MPDRVIEPHRTGRSLTVTAFGPCGPVLRRDTARLPSRAAHGGGPRCRSGGTSCHRLPRPGCYAAQPGGEGWPEPGLLYAACQRVLRPGGILGVITAGPPTRTVNSPTCPATWWPAPGPPGSSTPSTSSWCTPPSATASLIPTPLPSPSACQAAAESTPTCSSLSSPEDRYDEPPPGTRPRVPAAPGRRHLCVAERAPGRSSSEPGSALRSPVATGGSGTDRTALLPARIASGHFDAVLTHSYGATSGLRDARCCAAGRRVRIRLCVCRPAPGVRGSLPNRSATITERSRDG